MLLMYRSPRLRRGLQFGLAGLALALNAALGLVPSQAALAQSTGQAAGSGCGLADYPIPGGWFYTQEAAAFGCLTGHGPSRSRGYTVLDDGEASFWTEYRRYGGTAVLGYPVSQRYHYPVGSNGGYWYQAFERGILQWHPETQRAEMANVFEQFSENGFDGALADFGIPRPQDFPPSDFSQDAEQRMALLAEPQFVSRYFYDPVTQHSSDPDRAGEAAFDTQEQAWSFFGLPQTSAQRMSLTNLYPLVHNFYAQRFQKAGLQLYVQDGHESFSGMIGMDPTIVPGDGRPGCVVLTATGLLARTLGAGRLIPADKIQPVPLPPTQPDPHFTTYVPPVDMSVPTTMFQMTGTGFGPNEPLTISLTGGQQMLPIASGLTSGQSLSPTAGAAPAPSVAMPLLVAPPLPPVTAHTTTYADGSFSVVIQTRLGTYNVTVTGDKSKLSASDVVNTAQASITAATPTSSGAGCGGVGLPTWN
jgi:LGFP repeat-containing protein